MDPFYQMDSSGPTGSSPASQIQQLVSTFLVSDGKHSSSPHAVHQLIQSLRSSNLLFKLSNPIFPSSDAQDQPQQVHKLVLRINSLISSQSQAGYSIADLWLSQSPSAWHEANLSASAPSWLSHAINLITSPSTLTNPDINLLSSALSLVTNHILTSPSPSRQEFNRQVVLPNLPKFAQALSNLADAISQSGRVQRDAQALHLVITTLASQLRTHPAAYRQLAAKIHALCIRLLFQLEPESLAAPLVVASVQLLSALHLTGALAAKSGDGASSRATQAQLWQTTAIAAISTARDAWKECVSGFDLEQIGIQVDSGNRNEASQDSFEQPPLPTDPLLRTPAALARLELLLGSSRAPGVIQLLLRISTPRPVPLPVGSLLNLARTMLSLSPATPSKRTAEASLVSLQTALLPRLYIPALSLATQTVLACPAAANPHSAELLSSICALLEATKGSGSAKAFSSYTPTIKLAAFRTLSLLVGSGRCSSGGPSSSTLPKGAGLALDPSARITLRLARLSASQIGSVIISPASDASSAVGNPNGGFSSVPSSANGGGGGGGGGGRRNKKAKLYESDAVFGFSRDAGDGLRKATSEELGSTQAALEVLLAVYPHLVTELSPQHYDLGLTSAMCIMGLVEVLLECDSAGAKASGISRDVSGCSHVSLLVASLHGLAWLLMASPSTLLSLILARATKTISLARQASNSHLRSAAIHASAALNEARRGRLIPLVRSANSDEVSPPEGSKLSVQIQNTIDSNNPGAREQDVISRVLGTKIHLDPSQGNGSDVPGGEEEFLDETMEDEERKGCVQGVVVDDSNPRPPPTLLSNLGTLVSPSASPLSSPSRSGGAGLSPDPVKKITRPSTPRIGSPSAAVTVSSSERQHQHSVADVSKKTTPSEKENETAAAAAAAAAEIFGAGPSSPSRATTATIPRTPSNLVVAASTINDEEVGGGSALDQNDDDDDEEMPEIDLRDSDEESDGQDDGGVEKGEGEETPSND
ncbi:hypothetical protein IE53DRAFT_388858 [Violaceomyces palustris]|uniref:Uncharacterized protein n=1 Tax=Violaceomyces palustris TaxID=1673888 RepID=A0ACD0NSW8_9BASI|nr:hypothetical protein IE53DRAFT_388858 [Violaceomyces palustris]